MAHSEDPPPEAYHRVTNPERYASLHAVAERLLADLGREYDVVREETNALPWPKAQIARPTVRLTPRGGAGAPIQVSFTAFPGLHVRVGRWYVEAFPRCGCDACDEALDRLLDDVRFLATCAATGHFREEEEAGGRVTTMFGPADGRVKSQSGVPLAATPLCDAPSEAWEPWPRRPDARNPDDPA